jgi:putative membrane protein
VRFLYAVVVLLLAFIGAGFLEQNPAPVSLSYFGWSTPELPLSFLVVSAFAAGFLVALLLGLSGGLSGKVRLRRAEREARRLADEVTRLAAARNRDGGGYASLR